MNASSDWRQGVIYTVRPEILAPLEYGREYRILIGVRRIAGTREPFRAYGELYRRATALTEARVAALECPEAPPRWIAWHGWRALEAGDRQFIFVFISTVVKPGGPALTGERPPTDEELNSPGGATMEQLQQQGRPRIDEFYNDFDHRAAGEPAGEILFSYGEYVPSSEAVDFEPFVDRAEALARHHYGPAVRIGRREWFCATHPDVAVVHVFFHA